MDTSETYIKMRRKAIPDLGLGIIPADESLTWLQGSSVYTDEVGNFYFLFEQDGKTLTCQLERQDQLQEMFKYDNVHEMLDGFHGLVHTNTAEDLLYYEHFQTWEQLWLAFVMKEKYQKTWNGQEWVKA